MQRHNEQSILYSQNSRYVLDLYHLYLKNPDEVPAEWHRFFEQTAAGDFEDEIPIWPVRSAKENVAVNSDGVSQQNIIDSIRALMLVRAYRVRGHLRAQLDPLGLETPQYHAELSPQTYGFEEKDWDRSIYMDGVLGFQQASMRQIIECLQKNYSGPVGVEFMHIQNPDQKSWVQYQFEGPKKSLTTPEKLEIYEHILQAEAFERFLHVKFPGAKRFGLEGGESLMPALEALLKKTAGHKMLELIIGMSHRGRLSVLTNFLHQPMRYIFAQFQGTNIYQEDEEYGSSDVKYHSGYSTNRSIDGHVLHLSLAPNPSHLEAVNPVVLGKVRAKQERYQDNVHQKVLGILMHGDAAFAGQGMVAETLELSGLKGYRTGGTIHIIVNNQIGFTTSPPHSRTSPYSSDVAKIIQSPIFHVNGDDPETVVWAMNCAYDFQSRFHQDVVLDLICYRRNGHNEGDEPMFTQPKMYKKIAQHPSTATLYAQKLANDGIALTDIQAVQDKITNRIAEEFEIAKRLATDENERLRPDWLSGAWNGISGEASAHDLKKPVITGVDKAVLQEVGAKLLHIPQGFHMNSKLTRLWGKKRQAIESGTEIDWSTAEALAFGTLVVQGHPVRLSGQDSGRGTFSQRHAVLIDQMDDSRFIPLNFISDKQARFEVIDSPLAEASVMGFEYGYSSSNPNALVMWEGQFGDFANGAQVIIDQFIVSGEEKWLRLSGLVLLLPHGQEGQGPEHSSARLERFLQMSAQENMFVVQPTTPSNYFHVLRRQILASYRKPLIVMTPKSLLRHKRVLSNLSEMEINTHFMPVYGEVALKADQVERVVICSGKVYYDLLEEREKNNLQNVAIIRLEQFYPFPEKELSDALRPYQKAKIIWAQEEPYNMGGWFFVDRRLELLLTHMEMAQTRPLYAGRAAAASPATGIAARYKAEQDHLIQMALWDL